MKEVSIAESIINTYTEDEILVYVSKTLTQLRTIKTPRDASMEYMCGAIRNEIKYLAAIMEALVAKKNTAGKDPKIML